jgi:spore germination cell wall hydrolase CwlJ-like protein
MASKFNRAALVAVAVTLLTTLFGAESSSANAQDRAPVLVRPKFSPLFVSNPGIQPLPSATAPARADDGTPGEADSLRELVAQEPLPEELSQDMKCLAGAIYFEARGESLAGQLAVGRVIVDRTRSVRFPDTYCGVVFQRSQFSFVRGHSMPAIRTDSQAWRNAVAIAEIADAGSWSSPTEGALFFHAASVSPGWTLTRVAQIDKHIFYR